MTIWHVNLRTRKVPYKVPVRYSHQRRDLSAGKRPWADPMRQLRQRLPASRIRDQRADQMHLARPLVSLCGAMPCGVRLRREMQKSALSPRMCQGKLSSTDAPHPPTGLVRMIVHVRSGNDPNVPASRRLRQPDRTCHAHRQPSSSAAMLVA